MVPREPTQPVGRVVARATHLRLWVFPIERLRIETPLAFEDAHARLAGLLESDGLVRTVPTSGVPQRPFHGWARFGEVRLFVLVVDPELSGFWRQTYREALVSTGTIREVSGGSVLTLWFHPPLGGCAVVLASLGGIAWFVVKVGGIKHIVTTPVAMGVALYVIVMLTFLYHSIRAERALARAFL